MNKTAQDLKMKIESIKKIQTEEFCKWKIQAEITETYFMKRIQEMEELISAFEAMMKEMDIWVSKNVESKKLLTQII